MLTELPKFVKDAIVDTDRVPDEDLKEFLYVLQLHGILTCTDADNLVKKYRPKIYKEVFPEISIGDYPSWSD